MSEYTDRFVENRVDISVLSDLTEQHLKDLGIALGDRLKMLRLLQRRRPALPLRIASASTSCSRKEAGIRPGKARRNVGSDGSGFPPTL
jgi:hypothetical protein